MDNHIVTLHTETAAWCSVPLFRMFKCFIRPPPNSRMLPTNQCSKPIDHKCDVLASANILIQVHLKLHHYFHNYKKNQCACWNNVTSKCTNASVSQLVLHFVISLQWSIGVAPNGSRYKDLLSWGWTICRDAVTGDCLAVTWGVFKLLRENYECPVSPGGKMLKLQHLDLKVPPKKQYTSLVVSITYISKTCNISLTLL